MVYNPLEVEEEQIHFANVVRAFRNYEAYSISANNRRRKDIYKLPVADQSVLEALGYKEKLERVDEAILVNAQFLNRIVENPEIFGHEVELEGENELLNASEHTPAHGHSHGKHSHSHSRNLYKPTDFDMDKLFSTLKQFVRDWSAEGAKERDLCYNPMKDALLQHFQNVTTEKRGDFRVLVPGAGLGRLAFDVARLGFTCQGNEFSHYMLLSSYFILNRTNETHEHTIYPYVHTFSNVPTRQAMLQPISIPDVLPSTLPSGSNFSLVAGDFEEIYGTSSTASDEPHQGKWDAILTCFFIDTAKNIVNYLRILYEILADDGIWINLGPLLWHFENNRTNDTSIELDLEEVKNLARTVGFEISNERTIDTSYTNNDQGLLGYIYHAAFWTATKKVLRHK